MFCNAVVWQQTQAGLMSEQKMMNTSVMLQTVRYSRKILLWFNA